MPTLAPEADQKPKVAVIIVSFNSEPVIADCLHALLSSDYENIEVVVVDNGSRDRTRELVREKFPGVRLIQAGRNLGFAGGCNVGFEATDADIVVLLNDDAFVESDTISQMVSFLVSEPEAGVVGCKVLYPDGKKLQRGGGVLRSCAPAWLQGCLSADGQSAAPGIKRCQEGEFRFPTDVS